MRLLLLALVLLLPTAMAGLPFVRDPVPHIQDEGYLRVHGLAWTAGSVTVPCEPANGWGCYVPGAGTARSEFAFETDRDGWAWPGEDPEALCGSVSFSRSAHHVGAGTGASAGHSVGTRACVVERVGALQLWNGEPSDSPWKVSVLVHVFEEVPAGPCQEGLAPFASLAGIRGTVSGEDVDMSGTLFALRPC